ncbi:MAG: hypothetical protein AAF627_20555 [Myxococcota bacterium]
MRSTQGLLWAGIFPLLAAACGTDGDEAPRAGEEAARLRTVQVTRLELDKPEWPVFLNERIPVVLGLTAESEVPGTEAIESVPLLISFVDAQEPENEDLICSPNAFDLELVGDGVERLFEVAIWPISECGALAGRPVALMVEVDPTNEARSLSPPLVLTQSQASEPRNAACLGPEPGCVHELQIDIGPSGPDGRGQHDVIYVELSSDSSVGLIPRDPETLSDSNPQAPEDPQPTILVESRLLMNGRHPYESAVDPNLLPDDLVADLPDLEEDLRFGRAPGELDTLEDLPGEVRIRYALSAVSDQQLWLPFTIGTEDGRTDEVRISELTPGVPNDVSHELFLEEESLAAVSSGGLWENEDRFIVRGCFEADFAQLRPAPEAGECRSLEIVLVQDDGTVEGGALALGFEQVRRFSYGSRRIRAEAEFATRNTLNPSKISAVGEAELRLKGRIGRRFNVQLFRAAGSLEAGLDVEPEIPDDEERDPARDEREDDLDRFPDGLQELEVRVFGIDVLSKRSEGEEIEEDDPFTIKRSQRVFTGRFGFGPIGLTFDFHAGGEAGLNAEANLGFFDGEELCRPSLPAAVGAPEIEQCVTLTARVEPFVALTAEAFGGIRTRIVRAGVVVELVLARFGLPLDSGLALGLDTQNRSLVHAGVIQRLTFQPLEGALKLVGRIRFFRRSRSRSVTIVSFRTRELSRTLFSRQMDEAEVLTR